MHHQPFLKGAYDLFFHCTPEELQQEIAKAKSKQKRPVYRNAREARFYNGTNDRITILELIYKLRTGTIDPESFDRQIVLVTLGR